MFIDLQDFKGWGDIVAVWKDLSFSLKNINNFRKIAIVGDEKWQKYVAQASDYISKGEIKFYMIEDKEKALKWISH